MQEDAARRTEVEALERRLMPQRPLHGVLKSPLDVAQAANVVPGHCSGIQGWRAALYSSQQALLWASHVMTKQYESRRAQQHLG